MSKSRLLLSVLPLLALAACDPKPVSEQDAKINRASAVPVVIAEADGVRLWKVQDTTLGGARYVYFTSRGDTFSEQSCGKGCTEQTLVPAPP